MDREDEHNLALAQRAQQGDFDDELVLEQLARTRAFLGSDEALGALRRAFVVVVGCGGVGSHACAALARSGVARLRLVDFDQVTLSSLNRHAVATLADVGMPKVQCLQRRLVAVAPWVRFDLRLQKFEARVAGELLQGWDGDEGSRPDFVIDAIDNIDSKVELLKYCHDRGLPVISAMGAGTKSDPTRVMVADIGASVEDGLSRATRRRLKLLGVTSGIPVVYSTEKMGEGKAALLPLPEEEFQKGSVGDLGVLPDFRVRILPVLGTMPAVFGYTLANHVILKITGELGFGTAVRRGKCMLTLPQATRWITSRPRPEIRCTTVSWRMSRLARRRLSAWSKPASQTPPSASRCPSRQGTSPSWWRKHSAAEVPSPASRPS
jgi:tRNA A37 threonylcarbamoyladenosine dehydratase